MENRTVILPGGSGFLGRSLAQALAARGYRPVVLTRSPSKTGVSAREECQYWDGKSVGSWAEALEGAVAIVNLAGKSVNCRYTASNRREIIESRTNSVLALSAAINRCKNPPKVWVQAGSLAIYGDTAERWCTEDASAGSGFPVETCRVWEESFARVTGLRRVVLRIGFALGPGGGALQTLSGLTKCFLGGSVGSGRQYISWLHQADLNRMFLRAIEREQMTGVYNATSPNPVPNAVFMAELRAALHRPWSPPVPVWAVHIGSWFMRTEPCLALTGRRCTPRRLLEETFEFEFPNLREALRDVLGNKTNDNHE